ncbi:hypothetical protein QOZ88_04755 [Blastococcus sp. BMG 814]|uniref:DUF1440 domain-containing protein n=2 Tax=Blastococcus carthaginiensis TaxID=3050034 RepID=A0ABT9I8P6_9ACTN|nr:hypothetical protein [Blastococcus carthaginiensis]
MKIIVRVEKRMSTAGSIGRGVLAGIGGTAVMTAFQKVVEMPLTGRADSYAPAEAAESLLPTRTASPQSRKRLNYLVHFALGGMWGAAYGVAASAGLRGQKAVHAVFVTVYTGDVLLNTASGLYQPKQWSAQDWAIDIVDKYVQAQATGAVFDRFIDPTRPS